MKKLLSGVALLFVVAAVFVGCKPAEDQSAPPAQPNPSDVTNAVPAVPAK